MADIRDDGYFNDAQRDNTARLVATGAEITHMPEPHVPHVYVRWSDGSRAVVWSFGHAVINRPGHRIGDAELVPDPNGGPPLDPGRWVKQGQIFALAVQDDETGTKRWARLWCSSPGFDDEDLGHPATWKICSDDGGSAEVSADDMEAAARIIRWHKEQGE